MRCIYFGGDGICYANPPLPIGAGHYKPEGETRKKFCETNDFKNCPRFTAIHQYLNASKGK